MQLDNIDWNTVVPQITLAVAIISPVVVAIVNNAHNSKIRRLELNPTESIQLPREDNIYQINKFLRKDIRI